MDDITVADLGAGTQHVIGREVDVIRNQLARNRVHLLTGTGRFHDAHTMVIANEGTPDAKVSAERIIIAAGTRPARRDELTDARIPFEVGVSRYCELARGQIIGDSYGMLKLLVSPADRTLLGVHIFGTGATELVHIGQTVMGCNGTVDYLVDTVFNYPTLAESYKVAALDAMNKMRGIARLCD